MSAETVVPPGTVRPTTTYDPHTREYAENGLVIEAELREKCPVAWSPNYGGFWTISTHAATASTLQAKDSCSSAKSVDANGKVTGGVGIPAVGGYRVIPTESDPPEWKEFRRVLSPAFAPAAVAARRPRIAALTAEMINRVVTTGRADFVLDIADPVTALATLDLLGLPLSDWEFYADPIHRLGYDNQNPEVQEGIARVMHQLGEVVAGRTEVAAHGLVPELLAAAPDNPILTDRNLIDIIFQLLVGGFDTTASLLAGAFAYLEDKPAERARLLEGDEKFMRTATEEFVRWVSPVISLARTAVEDFEVDGCPVEKGDRLWVMFRSANHDSAVFDNPDDVNLARYPNRHLGFGSGIHRCLGSNLARAVFQIVIRQALVRLRDYAIDYTTAQRLPNLSRVNGWVQMPITFTPGEVIDAGLDESFGVW